MILVHPIKIRHTIIETHLSLRQVHRRLSNKNE